MNLSKHKILNIINVNNSDFYKLTQAYAKLVSHWNTIINVVSARDVDNLLTTLIHQSIFPLTEVQVPKGANLLDIGSGGGIPALPIKFDRPDLNITLLESRRNKAAFLRRVVTELNLENVEVVHSRLKEVVDRAGWQHHFDLITTRGTGNSAALFGEFESFVKPGGSIWFYKGQKAKIEASELSETTENPVRVLKIDEKLSLIIVEMKK